MRVLTDETLVNKEVRKGGFKKGGDCMQAFAIKGKLKKIGAVLILFILCASYTVSADQQFVLTVGETMVIPCLLEMWSDQSVNCVISNPEVLMSDGSGRAVIALSEGVSDVYVHMTNPDTDIRYTFVVEPAQHWDAAEGWTQPDEAAIDGRVLDSGEPRVNNETGSPGEADTDAGAGSRDDRAEAHMPEGDHADSGAEAHIPEDDHADSGAEAHMPEDDHTDSGAEAHMPEDDHADSGAEAHMSENDYAESGAETDISETDENDTLGTTESVPFWEKRGSGGISFVVIEDDLPGKTAKEAGVIDTNGAKYRPIAYLNADGEVVPLFVCAAGHEIRWKYIGRILYVEDSPSCTGPYRVSARDCRGNICYFSS